MRRAEETAARPPPFRVLAVPDGNYLSPGIPPPPPRAPEPYKVAPSSMSSSRAHRRSSFVIIADSRPATPESRSPSPGLNTGRVSPFRGRGFKGPPPRSKSRPQSPEVDPRKRPRTDRRVSVSQQNSPRRSLIPQPTTRRRSISLTKPNERPSSPKIGRRVDSRSRLNLSDSRNRLNASTNSNSVTNLSTRRQPTKPSTRLSPIQGTPTKPEKNASQVAKRDRSRETERPSPAKTPRFVGSPSKNAPNVKRFNQENAANPGKERLASPSKIPLKANRDGMASLNPARFITVPDQPNGKSGPKKNEKSTKDATKVERFAKVPSQSVKQTEGGSKETDSSGKSSGAQKVDAVDLIDLLKQNSSGATGTSSVVSTTTTTAAQPLHIDAHANRTEKESEKRNPAERRSGPERTKDQPETTNDKSAGSVTSNEDSRRSVPNGQEDIVQRSTNNPVSAKTGKGNNYNRGRPLADSRNESPVPTEAAANTSKGNNGPQSAKAGRVNGASSGGGSATQRPNRTHQGAGAFNEQNNRNVRPTHQRTERIEEVSPGQPASTNERSQSGAVVANQASKPGDTEAPGDFNKSTTSNYVSNVERAAPSGSASTKVVEPKVPSRSTEPAGRNGPATTTANATGQVTSARTSLVNSSAVNSSQNTNENQVGVNNPGNVTEPRGVTSGRARNGNRGSDASLKSSGVSTDSNESVRSTDTGVSVNTVKGVSSPREKTGMHVVKRPQEIETLSGNVMHHEQNVEGKETLVDQFLIGGKSQNFPIVEYVYCVSGTGAPSLLDGGCYSSLEGRLLAATNGAEAEQPSSDRFLARWKKSVADYCGCCRSMRCLACRTDSKKISWPKKQARTAVAAAGSEAAPQLPADAAAPEPTQTGWWARVKGGCRCDRLKAIKCCSRGSRIAPAEATACCPPERRFGAICHRLFERCKCRRAEAERKRSIRAKHSLTSVAPPPLSEEPKAKIPDVLVEHNSLMRGAIPCLPVPLAWFCLVWNVLLPGSGTVWSGLFNLCTGQPRFSPVAGLKSRLGALVVNLVVGVGQLFTVLFCLVGWGWSIWWGVTLVRLARKYKRYKASEAANNDPEARGEPAALPPGVPSQALREMERAR